MKCDVCFTHIGLGEHICPNCGYRIKDKSIASRVQNNKEKQAERKVNSGAGKVDMNELRRKLESSANKPKGQPVRKADTSNKQNKTKIFIIVFVIFLLFNVLGSCVAIFSEVGSSLSDIVELIDGEYYDSAEEAMNLTGIDLSDVVNEKEELLTYFNQYFDDVEVYEDAVYNEDEDVIYTSLYVYTTDRDVEYNTVLEYKNNECLCKYLYMWYNTDTPISDDISDQSLYLYNNEHIEYLLRYFGDNLDMNHVQGELYELFESDPEYASFLIDDRYIIYSETENYNDYTCELIINE